MTFDPSLRTSPASARSRLVVLAVTFAAVLMTLAYPARTYWDQKRQIDGLRAEQMRSQSSIDSMNEALLRWQDRAYVEDQARKRLGYTYPGQLVYRVVPAPVPALPAVTASTSSDGVADEGCAAGPVSPAQQLGC